MIWYDSAEGDFRREQGDIVSKRKRSKQNETTKWHFDYLQLHPLLLVLGQTTGRLQYFIWRL